MIEATQEAVKQDRLRGFVKKVRDDGSWGFIQVYDTDEDVFWHWKSAGKKLRDGTIAEFTPISMPGKCRAARDIVVLG